MKSSKALTQCLVLPHEQQMRIHSSERLHLKCCLLQNQIPEDRVLAVLGSAEVPAVCHSGDMLQSNLVFWGSHLVPL